MIFVDSNIFIDLIDPQSDWYEWSQEKIVDPADELVINHVVLAEVARQFASLAEQQNYFATLGVLVELLDEKAAFRAGQAHNAYRRAGGVREGILADFLICAHAATLGATLLTRDRQRFAAYFPELTLITPETHP